MKRIKLENAVGGVHPNGNATYTAGADIALGEPVKFSDGKVVPCSAATDAAVGVALDGADSGDIVPIAVLGNYTGTVQLRAAGAIAAGAQVTAEAKTTSGATDVIIGRALAAASAAGDLIEIAHQVAQVK